MNTTEVDDIDPPSGSGSAAAKSATPLSRPSLDLPAATGLMVLEEIFERGVLRILGSVPICPHVVPIRFELQDPRVRQLGWPAIAAHLPLQEPSAVVAAEAPSSEEIRGALLILPAQHLRARHLGIRARSIGTAQTI